MAISKAASAGNIKMMTVNGRKVVNLDHHLTQEYLRDKVKPEKPDAEKQPINITVVKQVKERAKKITAPPAKDDEPPDLMIRCLNDVNSSNLMFLEKKELDKFKVYEQALTAQQQRLERRGELIERKFVRQSFGKLYQIHTSQFKTMEDRLASEICALFGMTSDVEMMAKVREKISEDNAQTLGNIKRLFDEAVKKMGGTDKE